MPAKPPHIAPAAATLLTEVAGAAATGAASDEAGTVCCFSPPQPESNNALNTLAGTHFMLRVISTAFGFRIDISFDHREYISRAVTHSDQLPQRGSRCIVPASRKRKLEVAIDTSLASAVHAIGGSMNSDTLVPRGGSSITEEVRALSPKYTTEPVPVPVSFVPTPTQAFRQHRKVVQVVVEPGAPRSQSANAQRAHAIPIPFPLPIPLPLARGSRVLIWKQDPSVGEIGARKVFIPGNLHAGPTDSRIRTEGLPPVSPNSFGDFIATPGTDAFDAIHTFAVVRETLTMFQRARGGTPVPWQWNTAGNTDPLRVFPQAGVTQNAYYSRTEKALKFFYFDTTSPPPTHTVFTCRSLDIVAHETGHAVLDGLQPGWLAFGNPPQTGGLHESFGDLTAIFLALSQLDQVEAVIAQTKANLHDKTFLADLAEEFGLALGRPNGLRNADNDLRLSQTGSEVHAISQVFTGAIYDILADLFAFERRSSKRDDAATLYDVSQYLLGLVLRALIAAPAAAATYADVANQMLSLAAADGKPVQYRTFIRNRFTLREVVVSPVPLSEGVSEKDDSTLMLEPAIVDAKDAIQNRDGCCGTLNQPEYRGKLEDIDEEYAHFKKVVGKAR
jgi:hypothetical protein